jgi:hypothetical protein
MKIRIFIGIVLLSMATVASAAIVQYDNRGAWEGAAGTVDLSEDFEGFNVDTSFASPLAIGAGSIAQELVDAGFRNFVDVPPFMFGDNNGTRHASSFVNHIEASPGMSTAPMDEETAPPSAELQTFGTNVRITFTNPVSAFGTDLTGVLGGEFLAIDVMGAGDVVLGTLLPQNNDTFLGFVADGGESVTSVVCRSQNLNPGAGGEGFGMDNIDAVSGGGGGDGGGAVPATSGIALVLLVLAIATTSMLVMRRRRATN